MLPAIPTEDEVGVSGEMDANDLVTPICSIVQPSSGSERGDDGNFWFSDGKAVAQMEIVVLEIAGTRTLWAPKSEGQNTPACRSANRKEGITTEASKILGAKAAKDQGMQDGDTVYLPCDLCPHYKDDPFGSADWLCKPGYTLLLHNQDGPFLFFVKGTAVPPIQRAIVSPALRRIQQKQPAAPWQTLHQFSLRLTENDKGKFWVPQIAAMRVLDPDEALEYRELSMSLRGRVAEAMEDAALEEGQQGLSGAE